MTPRRLRSNLRLLTQPWIGPILALITVICGGALGYRITEGWDWGDCFWMVLITISTIGYGEVEPLSTAGRLVTVLIVVGGLIVVQLAIQRVLGLKDAGYFRRLQEFRIHRMLESLRDHVILCGYGNFGRTVSDRLGEAEIRHIVVTDNTDDYVRAGRREGRPCSAIPQTESFLRG